MQNIWTWIGWMAFSAIGGYGLLAPVVWTVSVRVDCLCSHRLHHRLNGGSDPEEISSRWVSRASPKGAHFILVGGGYRRQTDHRNSGAIRTAVIFGFYLSNEGISILENTALIGLPVPQKLGMFWER